MLALEEEAVITDAATTITTTTTIIMVVVEYRSNLMFFKNFIVGPTVSTHPMTVAVAPTSSPATRMQQSTPIKWVDGKRTHYGDVGLSLPEALWGRARVT